MPLITDATQDNVHLELPNMFDKATQLRPGDVVLKHPINSTTEAHQTTLIDVTLIPPYRTHHVDTSFLETAKRMQKHHQSQEYKKFKIKDHPSSNSTSEQLAQELVTKNSRMLPFTIDHHGMLGPIASEFLLGHEYATFQVSPNEYENRTTSAEVKELINLSMKKNDTRTSLQKQTKHGKKHTEQNGLLTHTMPKHHDNLSKRNILYSKPVFVQKYIVQHAAPNKLYFTYRNQIGLPKYILQHAAPKQNIFYVPKSNWSTKNNITCMKS